MATPTEPSLPAGRAICAACRRPAGLCYCAHVPQLHTRTKVVLLQHPRERDMAIGTARMVRLCLPDAELHVGVNWDDSPALAAAISDPARPAILLYPGDDARDVLIDPPAGPVTLIVVDGTWSNARNLVRDSAVLSALPRYAFTPPRPSEYRIRREPSIECVSTIEAVAMVLGSLEGDAAAFEAMLTPFRAMIDAHVAAREAHAATSVPRHKRRPQRPVRAPELDLLRAHRDRIVCVTGEANAWRYAEGGTRDEDELVHWVAHRPSTGTTIDLLACPTRALSPSTPFHLQLDEATLRAGIAPRELVARATAFARPDDIWCSWGYYALTLARAAGVPEPAHYVDLRALAQRLARGRKVGMLEDYAVKGDFEVPPPFGQGRAGLRVTGLSAVLARWLA